MFLAKETFGAGDAGYGLLVSLWGGGMVLGSALMAVLGGRINLVLLYFLSIFVGASALVGTGLAPVFVLALCALTVEGAATGIDNVATDTILQERVPDAFLGRVFSIRFLGYSAGEALAYPRAACSWMRSGLAPLTSTQASQRQQQVSSFCSPCSPFL